MGGYRPRVRRALAPLLVAAGCAAAVAVLAADDAPGWLAWCPAWLRVPLAAALGAAGAWWAEALATGHQAAVERDQPAVDRLGEHLGRRAELPGIGSPGADPLLLRVHPAAPTEPPGGELPPFVERDVGDRVRQQLRGAATDGGFLVLVGNSCVGKTRLLYEATREVLPDFAVLAPDLGDGGLVEAIADASFPLPKLVVWLDELQRFLPGPYFVPDERAGHAPLSAGAVRRLLQAPTPVVIVGTLWPEYFSELRATEPDPESATGLPKPRYPQAVDILDAGVRHIAVHSFSRAEREAAAALADRDPRLGQAVADPDYNVTESLAGAPQLMRRYRQATDAQKAVLDAAVDARRLGIRSPLTGELLGAAARGYLTAHHPDDTWFDTAVAELTSTARRDDRATAPLIELLSADRRTVTGYAVADYLLQQLARERRADRVPAVTWQALVERTEDDIDAYRLLRSAEDRMLYRIAEDLRFRRAARSRRAAEDLARSLVRQGRTAEALQALRVHVPEPRAAGRLAEMLAEAGRADEAAELLRDGAELDTHAASRLTRLLGEQGHLDELRSRAAAGDQDAELELAKHLKLAGRYDEAVPHLRRLAAAGVAIAAVRLAGILTMRGPEGDEEARQVLRPAADRGDATARWHLSSLLESKEHRDELRTRADAGDLQAADRLATALGREGRVDELRQRADAGDAKARLVLAGLLDRQDDGAGADDAVAELRARADAGDEDARRILNVRLRNNRDIDALRDRVAAGDADCVRPLATLLAERGRTDEALALLQPPADDGHTLAAHDLAQLLIRLDRLPELHRRADSGDRTAALQLANAYTERDRPADAAEVLRPYAADKVAASKLARLLARTDRVDEAVEVLRPHAEAGDESAIEETTSLLRKAGRTDDALALLRVRADARLPYAAHRLLDTLFSARGIEALYEEVHAGTEDAAEYLLNTLTREGAAEEADRLRTEGFEPPPRGPL
ncbi:hypothetical protein G5C51_38620 [Streptomyces sp. A7024]|uniref:Tetratricopeptide repeat protein n=1 Tax=Streptomyces coryli TaxID=1128680 RepID=A0A6G4UEI9_9ACTN|nr:hypothetical protein [Streptomyces coryli]NGN69791.1 hypothetical protein [Streptomyces coryli]